jgi:hypothetical protein
MARVSARLMELESHSNLNRRTMTTPSPESQEHLSQVRPILTGPVICDLAARDPASGKWNLLGIFNHVSASRFPTQRPLSVYLKLSDAAGLYELEIRFVRVSTGERLAQATAKLTINDRLVSQDVGVSFPQIPIPAEGKYEFQVWANAMHLGAVTFNATPISREPSV